MMAELPDRNLFMMCRRVRPEAGAPLPHGYRFALCGPEDLPAWYAFPFDTPEDARRFLPYMQAYFARVYAPRAALFHQRCLLVRSQAGEAVGTCFLWPAYGRVTTLHWLKVRREHEGRGIGRALIARAMQQAAPNDYPVYLHTQPESFRAISLYADFGFALLTDPMIGPRRNHLDECLPWLRQQMGARFDRLTFATAGAELIEAASMSADSEF